MTDNDFYINPNDEPCPYPELRCTFKIKLNGRVCQCERPVHPRYDEMGNRTYHLICETLLPQWMEEYQEV